MAAYKNKIACVVDHGLFVGLAETLAKEFKKVLYWCPWESAFPKSNSTLIGKGLPGVEPISSIWSSLDEIDLFVFPDVYQGPLQEHLVSIGKRVWGGRMGEQLETNRVGAKQHMASLGIDIGPYTEVKGLDALREHLKAHKKQYVKVSKTRGDFETFFAKNYDLAEPLLDDLEHRLGAKKKTITFVSEDAIENAVEVGYDGYCIDGKYPKQSFWGIEIKDKAYVGRANRYADLPYQVSSINEKLAPTLREFQYRGFISSEIRITKDGKAYAIDPCARMGSPPGELYQVVFTNLADILWHGAEGELVEPKLAAQWGAELIIHSSWADQHWQSLSFPKSIRDNIKLRNHAIIEGKDYVVPQAVGLPEIGAVVALGSTREEAVKECCRIAEKIEGHSIDTFPEAFDEADDEIEELKTFGIDFAGSKKKQEPSPLGETLAGVINSKRSLGDTLASVLDGK